MDEIKSVIPAVNGKGLTKNMEKIAKNKHPSKIYSVSEWKFENRVVPFYG